MVKDQISIGWTIAVWVVAATLFLGALGIGGALVTGAVRPFFIQQEANQFRASQQYTESHRDLVLALVADYNQLDAEIAQDGGTHPDVVQGKRGQQIAIRARITNEIAKMDPALLPPEVLRFQGAAH